MMVVTANAQGRSSGEVTADAMKIAKAIEFPPGFGIELTGASQSQQEVFSNLGIALVSGVAADVPGAGDAVRLVHGAGAR